MMQTLAALNMGNIWMGLFIVGFLVICIVLMLAVLIQKPQGGGLAGAFGSGAGSGQTAFGAKTGDALTWFTIATFVVWLIAAVGLNLAFRPADTTVPTAIAPEGTTTTETGAPESGTPATEGGETTDPGQPVPIQPVPIQPVPVPPPGEGAEPAAPPASEPAPAQPETQPQTPPAPEPAPVGGNEPGR